MNQRVLLKFLVLPIGMSLSFFAFQNFSNKTLDSEPSKTGRTPASINNISNSYTPSDVSIIGTTSGGVTFEDISTGNGVHTSQFKQTIKGVGGPGLRGCVARYSQASHLCKNDSDFRIIAGANESEGWTYNSLADVYSINVDVSSRGFPHEQYLTRLILPNGDRREFNFMPRKISRMIFVDRSTAKDDRINFVNQEISGAGGRGLRACLTTKSNSEKSCVSDSEYKTLASHSKDHWSYNSNADIYSVRWTLPNTENWPLDTYVGRYILPGGQRLEVSFTPRRL